MKAYLLTSKEVYLLFQGQVIGYDIAKIVTNICNDLEVDASIQMICGLVSS
jgi:hypothetical protein